jgi:hypothetical protein
MEAWVVVVEEINPPADVEPIKWVLFTSVPVVSFEDAWQVIGWYENRWLVEEWHKALKTGCRLESHQLQSMVRMLPLTGVLSVGNVTNYEFWRAVAKLGGFLGRRHDGEPDWQLIWRGWNELHTVAEGAMLLKKCG